MTLHSRKKTKVQQTGKTLVAAYYNASPPLIWKFDLERNHSFALALQGDDGDWELGVTSPKEEFHPVARFISREDAEEAFAKTQKALLHTKSNIWKKITFLLLVLIILFIGFVVLSLGSLLRFQAGAALSPYIASAPLSPSMIPPPPPALPSETPPTPVQQGVPLPADQVLKLPQ